MSIPLCATVALTLLTAGRTTPSTPDLRNIRTGVVIADEGYCDQPYVVITKDGNWLCVLTTGKGEEGDPGQHIIATISNDKGKSWSPLIDIEPADGPEASWAMPLITPSGRVYVFYDYNGDRVNSLNGKSIGRADMLGWYVYKYSDDNGRTWSDKRYRLPVRETPADRDNDWQGKVQLLWGIGQPIIDGQSVYFGFSKIGKYVIDKTEGWFFRSDNILTEPDPDKHVWHMLPEGDAGLCSPKGSIAEEQNLVPLNDGSLYAMYRTVAGSPCHAYSRDGGKTWTPPAFATYTPGGRQFKHPRACPRLWKTANGKYLLWFHNHSGTDYIGRNPAWITGGVEKDGLIYWSQPEILLYDPNTDTRMSYPDLIEHDGHYWVTETQKMVARVHEVDSTLLEGLWNQATNKTAVRKGLLVDLPAGKELPKTTALSKLPQLGHGHGFTIDVWFQFPADKANHVLVDAVDRDGRGFRVATGKKNTILFSMMDGNANTHAESDPITTTADGPHHAAIIVDGGPKIISLVVDGVLSDGGSAHEAGWYRFDPAYVDVSGDGPIRLTPAGLDQVKSLRIYDRALRTSEAVGNYQAGLQ